ncbi:hypothetical protein H257_03776 [Aphanomyces astaci]|uniref:Uncharacterized protein n=1 Tax=Aphanomyces astaci TaxID=112090 RepID=W4GZ82_APHAT|nr:hypothetical protein H257_03776 [Aphanomyces astaci]ETV84626.1 hypothetical protein H257_03776 [Aphanomyces astaci]|eukprot:XP_009826318.1 hypothetical protein H257_03776 [Aphanomyces astaci]
MERRGDVRWPSWLSCHGGGVVVVWLLGPYWAKDLDGGSSRWLLCGGCLPRKLGWVYAIDTWLASSICKMSSSVSKMRPSVPDIVMMTSCISLIANHLTDVPRRSMMGLSVCSGKNSIADCGTTVLTVSSSSRFVGKSLLKSASFCMIRFTAFREDDSDPCTSRRRRVVPRGKSSTGVSWKRAPETYAICFSTAPPFAMSIVANVLGTNTYVLPLSPTSGPTFVVVLQPVVA